MDEFYDIAKITNDNTQEGSQMSDVSLQRDDNNFVWQLIKQINEDTEELVFMCMGVICEADLLLVIRTPSIGQDKMITLSQYVTLTGFGCMAFDEAIATLQEIRLTGEREFKNGMLDKWTPSTYQGFPTFKLSNRYF
ncbi:hypothetical protein IW262DRAFT_1299922 [Armillaria fumosa]|nr:hypothetical protein IW262DRAFT_1299922 [Armillaria fumosa]